MPNTVLTVEHSTYLWCIAINNQRQVLGRRSFQLMAPLDTDCDIIFIHLRIAVPSLRRLGPTAFSLHKPRTNTKLKSSDVFPVTLAETEIDLRTSVRRGARVRDEFPPVLENKAGNINAIIRLDHECEVNAFDPGSLYARSGAIPLVTIRLEPRVHIQRPTELTLTSNYIRELEDSEPAFVTQLETDLVKPRHLLLDSDDLPYEQLVKALVEKHVGRDHYQKYFTDTSDNAPVSSLEFIHYNEILRDEQIANVGAYRANKESHIQYLLRKLMTVFDGHGVSCRL